MAEAFGAAGFERTEGAAATMTSPCVPASLPDLAPAQEVRLEGSAAPHRNRVAGPKRRHLFRRRDIGAISRVRPDDRSVAKTVGTRLSGARFRSMGETRGDGAGLTCQAHFGRRLMRIFSMVFAGLIIAASIPSAFAANQPASRQHRGMSKGEAFNACRQERYHACRPNAPVRDREDAGALILRRRRGAPLA